MHHLPGYQIQTIIHRGKNCTVSRALRDSDQQPVIIKQLNSSAASAEEIARFEHEFNLLSSLDIDGIIAPQQLVNNDSQPTLVFPDHNGISLRQMMLKNTYRWDQVLPVAIQLSNLVGQLHAARIIHKKISPDNILWLPDSNEVRLIDFSIATRLTREQASWNAQQLQPESLHYMAPEQTGRINRHIDYRSDFYSLGATLYELFTLRPPFFGKEGLQLIHSHIAQHPQPPQQVNPDLPEVPARIVLKLLAKDASQRYQSSFGLCQDLKRCHELWQQHREIPVFPIARQDTSEHFAIPQRLYGRAGTIQALKNSFDRAGESQQEMVLITGYAGVGKSSLVHELRHYIHQQNGRFISGKFDQYRRSRPYLGIFLALQGLIRQLLTENEQEISVYRDAITRALGQNAQALVRLVPELELIIGKQHSEARLSATEEQNRFSRLVINLLKVFATTERPLLLFLDDLHWADLASFSLIESLTRNNSLPNLLIIASYRDHEVSPTHPLSRTLERLRNSPCQLTELELQPLTLGQTIRLIADTLRCEPQRCQSLGQICLEKTQGNPFFLIQFLHSLHDEGLISYQQNRWQWDEEKIRSREMTDNVIDLMMRKIKKLPVASQEVLQLAACIGSPFTLQTLSTALRQDNAATTRELWDAVSEGLLIPLDSSYSSDSGLTFDKKRYRFVHDRIQQAAYSLIPESRRQALHLQIGQILQQQYRDTPDSAPVFEITNHLNNARPLITQSVDKIHLAELNAQAGIRALDSAAFDAALEYLNSGISLLPDDSWQNHYQLSLNLFTHGAEVSYIRADYQQMDEMIEAVLAQAHDLLDRVRVYEIRIQALIARNQFDQAMQLALEVLKTLGVELPPQPRQHQIWQGILRTQWLLSRRDSLQVLNAPPMTDPRKLAALSILASMFGIIKFSSSNLRPLVMARQVELTLTQGLTTHSAMAFAGYGGILCGQFNAINQGYNLGQMAMELDQRQPARLLHHKTLYLFNTYVRHWKEPLRNTLDSMLEGHQLAQDCGDVEWGSYCLAAWIQYAFNLTDNFAERQPLLEQYTESLQQYGQKQSVQYSLLALQAIDNMRGLSDDVTQLSGRFFNQQLLDENRREDHRTAICLYHYYSALLCYLVNDYDQAFEHTEAGQKFMPHIGGTFTVPCFTFITALTHLSQIPKTGVLQQPHKLKQVRKSLKKLKRWARHCPDNHLHFVSLIRAELYRVHKQYAQAMDHYDIAIGHSQQQGFHLVHALANEMAGRCYLEWGKQPIARTYLNEAWHAYQGLQLKAKLEQMTRGYPQQFGNRSTAQQPRNEETSVLQEQELSNQHLDTISIIRSSQAISDEIVLEKLLGRLMRLALENAGAQRAILILKQTNGLYVEAETELEQTPRFFEKQPLDSSQLLPVSVVHYVARTKDTVVLSNAHSHDMFMQDGYLRQHKPRSLLCMPILYHSELTAILYLENNESRNVFDRARMETLQILSAQAAISIENAKLYSSLEQSEHEYRSLFENSVEAIFRASAQGHFISANPALAELLGYSSPEEFLDAITDIGSQCFVHQLDLQNFLAQLDDNNRVIGFETQWLRRGGSPVYVSISAIRHLDEQGNALYYEGSLTNITERIAKESAERQQREAQLNLEKAEAASLAKSEFLATMSHEIRTPMNGILGMAQLLQKGTLSHEQQRQVQAIYQSGQSLLSILNDVLDFTKAEAGQIELDRSPFSLRKVLDEMQLILEPMTQEKQLTFRLRIHDPLPGRVLGDRRSLGQVLMNLCANAVKFTEQGFVHVDVRCTTTSDQALIEVEVQDSGIGISKEAHSRIFQHFSQADSSITRRYGGTGLGLAISKQIIEKQQGQIGFDSQPDKGSRFWFRLGYPLAVSDPTEVGEAAHRTPSESLQILLVEDTEINQQVVTGLLQSDGHRVAVAADGYSALQMHDQHDYDLILMDIHLPDMDGMETTRRIREHRNSAKANIRIIALTASITEAEINNYHAAGIDGVIGKPLQYGELQTLLGTHPKTTTPATPDDQERTQLDMTLIEQHCSMLGQDKFLQLLTQLQQQCESLLQQLEEAATNGDHARTAKVAHQLAGASANFGLKQLSQRCKAVEKQSHLLTPAELQELQHLLQNSLIQLQKMLAG
ncbi:MAG: AAA family ATPase [Amphritea sp.]|nr:AAA family ATPase [Amphritea sp.]